MRNYVKETLLEGEKIILMSRRHWIVFLPVMIWLAAAIYFYFGFVSIKNLAIFPFILAIIQGILATIDYLISEIVVTNMRVIIKVGLIARLSYETLLKNIASIDVVQPFWGRIFGYGSVTIYDTGYRSTAFTQISSPFTFRRAVQSQIEEHIPEVRVVPSRSTNSTSTEEEKVSSSS